MTKIIIYIYKNILNYNIECLFDKEFGRCVSNDYKYALKICDKSMIDLLQYIKGLFYIACYSLYYKYDKLFCENINLFYCYFTDKSHINVLLNYNVLNKYTTYLRFNNVLTNFKIYHNNKKYKYNNFDFEILKYYNKKEIHYNVMANNYSIYYDIKL